MSDFFSINRSALLLRPSRDMVEWLNNVQAGPRETYQAQAGDDDLHVFLVPEFDSADEGRDWLEENCEPFIRYVLEDWCADEDVWPKSLDWELFQKFFEYTIQTIVTDTVDDDYDEEEGEEDWG